MQDSIFTADTRPAEERTKVLIEVRGGQVQTVYCNKDVDVIIVDWDEAREGADGVNKDVRYVAKNWLGMRRIIEEAEETTAEKQRKTA